MHGLPVRFVVRFTALPGRGAWEAVLRLEDPGEPLAGATGGTPQEALAALLPQVSELGSVARPARSPVW